MLKSYGLSSSMEFHLLDSTGRVVVSSSASYETSETDKRMKGKFTEVSKDICAAEIQEYMEGIETASEALENIQKKVNQDFASEKRYILNYLGQ